MTTNPILGREELRRFPFPKRPVAQPGTALVFQTSNGGLVAPAYPAVSGDVTLGRFRVAYTVDVTPHKASFSYQAPSRDAALKFNVKVSYSWQVTAPVTVVRQRIDSPTVHCEQYLNQDMRLLCRDIDIDDDAAAEAAIRRAFPPDRKIPLPDVGVTISGIFAEVYADDLVVQGGRTRHSQKLDMEQRETRTRFFDELVRTNDGAAVMLADDPSKTAEAYAYIDSQLRSNRQATLDAMKVVLDGGYLQPGDLDPAVRAIVQSVAGMLERRPTESTPAITSTTIDMPAIPHQTSHPDAQDEPSTDDAAR